jgi:hypothetical protein
MPNKDQQREILKDSLARLTANGGRIVPKTGWFWVAIHYAVMILTFGSNRTFLNGYYTTLGNVVGVPKSYYENSIRWPLGVAETIEHENVHITQAKKWGLGNVWLGYIPYGICYLLLPLPLFFAYFRYRFEREAYAHGINFYLQFYPNARDRRIYEAVAQLTSGAYGWTWIMKRQVKKWFKENINE